ncbi:hypothetical protein JY452_02820 [Stenotrophomonas maltophilia]|uniref:hypothetical protein n=1 Tax=Stenotrophomonas TaxID=40323 RepID=UPI00166674DB|nr:MULTISPECIES: hypothetical protein [Stenotrophomonas]MBN5124939.1 hypothetical protein [Stenotrophomonas maltophilia]MBN5175746.1 hypothetical protein [Stenotrophomonas maltophilia]MDQ7276130.1 hypothetical protein [Stenotrophomonas sp. Sm3147]MDQ7286908.1 hypothetical protein [Stenotrophomonas sp. Sm5341]
MSNDNKTLADVQPGGRVRLATVPYDRARDLMNDAYNAGTHGIGYSQQAMELHDAIIPAQPSPGGQEDDSDLLAELRDVEDYFEDVDPNPIHLATVRAAIEALAARQPVHETDAYQQGFRDGQDRTCTVVARQSAEQEPVAHRLVTGDPKRKWMVVQGAPSIGVIRQAQEYGWEVECFYSHTFKPTTPSWATPTAQVVGLDGLREMLESWKNSDYPFSYDGQCAQRALDACVEDLQGWLDSQAVGK